MSTYYKKVVCNNNHYKIVAQADDAGVLLIQGETTKLLVAEKGSDKNVTFEKLSKNIFRR
jgi:hypothetical protein